MAFSTDSDETKMLLEHVAAGDLAALERLLELHRPYLRRVAQMKLDSALSVRVDASDVVQETQLVIVKRIDDFIKRRPTSLRLWMRRKVLEQLVDQRRRHVSAQKRSIHREKSVSNMSSVAIARNLLSNTPSKILRKIELQDQVSELIEQLGENDRKILSLRHAECLSNVEVADLLGIAPGTARKRHGRALLRIHRLLVENNISMDGTMG